MIDPKESAETKTIVRIVLRIGIVALLSGFILGMLVAALIFNN